MASVSSNTSYIESAAGKARAVKPLMWVVSAAFLVYFADDPISQVLGID